MYILQLNWRLSSGVTSGVCVIFYNRSTIYSSLSTIALTTCILALHRVSDSRLTDFVTAFFKNSHRNVKHEKKRYMFSIIPKYVTKIDSNLAAVTPTKFNEWLSQLTNNALWFFSIILCWTPGVTCHHGSIIVTLWSAVCKWNFIGI